MPLTEKKRIGYDLRWKTGTLDHYVGDLLAALVAEGKEEFHFVCYGDPKDREFAEALGDDAEFKAAPWPRYGLASQIAFPRALRKDRIQLLHCPFYVMPLFPGSPTIVTFHDVIPFTKYGDKRGLARLLVCSMYRLAARRAAAIVTVSNFSRQDIVRELRVPESKVTVAHDAPGAYAFIESKSELYAQHAPYFACMTARHIGSKNTVTAIKAWKIFRERTGLPHKLLIGGKTTEEGKALLAQAGCAEGCHLLGFVADEQLSSFFHNAEAFIIPSLYEGFGLPPLEAMAAGAPVLSSDAASLPEVCGDAALYFNPSSPEQLASLMIRISGDPALRAQMMASGKRRAQGFTYRQSAARILELYRELLNSGRRPRGGR